MSPRTLPSTPIPLRATLPLRLLLLPREAAEAAAAVKAATLTLATLKSRSQLLKDKFQALLLLLRHPLPLAHPRLPGRRPQNGPPPARTTTRASGTTMESK